MAFATKTLRDDNIPTGAGSAGGLVVVRLDHASDSATTAAAVDASGLSGHANGAKLSIVRIHHALAGSVLIEFKGASADTTAIRLTGTGTYAGPAIANDATNTTATSGDLETVGASATGYIILELRKDKNFTA
jgi:hypothetical protein|tara:strand:+ start:4994 stop:5392 length:399 start_codon:yes stop_codon:yes gene_type:complete